VISSASVSRLSIAMGAILIVGFGNDGALGQTELSQKLIRLFPKPLPGWRAGPVDVKKEPGGELLVRRNYSVGNNLVVFMIRKSDKLPKGDPRKAVKTDPYLRRAGARIFVVKGRPAILAKVGGLRQGMLTVNRKIMIVAVGMRGLGAPGLAQWDSVIRYLRATDLRGLASIR